MGSDCSGQRRRRPLLPAVVAVVLGTLTLAIVLVAPAMAADGIAEDGAINSGFVDPVAGQNPHGGYSNTTNKCKVCHAVHGAAGGGEKLLRTTVRYYNSPKYAGPANCSAAPDGTSYCHVGYGGPEPDPPPPYPDNSPIENSPSMSCVYCHITGPYAITKVYGGDATNYWMESTAQDLENNHASSHGMGPDNSGYQGCTSCHSVHGGGTWDPVTSDSNTATYILRNNPASVYYSARYGMNSDGAWTNDGSPRKVTNMDEFCRDCHDMTGLNGANPAGSTWCSDHCHQTWDTYTPDGSRHSGMQAAGLITQNTEHNGVSHIMTSDLNNADGKPRALAGSEHCTSCHSGGDHTASNSFPHMTSGAQFLADDHATTTQLDNVCLDCHDDKIPNNGFGVGDSF
jgi:hypothetical protein